MKIIQLEYFCAVSRYHSITQAAQKLFVTQPAISTAIKELEKEFSVNLFVRSKNHLTLTTEGEIFYQKAQELLQSIDQTTQQLYDLGKQTPSVRIGIPPLLSTIYFPDLYLDFQKKYPDIPLELSEYGSIRASRLVQEEQLDVALVNMHFYDIDKMNSCTLRAERIVFCVSKHHHLAREKQITIEQLKDEPIIMYNTDSVQNTTLNSRFENAGITPNIIMHASQLYTIEQFLQNGNCGAVLYSSLVKNMNGVKGIPITPVIQQEVGIVWKKGKYMNGSVEKWIDFIQNKW